MPAITEQSLWQRDWHETNKDTNKWTNVSLGQGLWQRDMQLCNSTSGLWHSQGSESKSEGGIAEDIEA